MTIYKGKNAKASLLNEDFERKYGDGWKVYSNEPDFPLTVVANDTLEEVTQVFTSNYELKRWMKRKWYHPRYTNVELDAFSRRRVKKGLYRATELIPNSYTRKRLYIQLIIPRIKKV